MQPPKNILLVARPDHSMQIYRALLQQEELSFHYITFKVVRSFIKKIIPYQKLQTVSRCCTIAIRQTFVQVCKKTFHFKFAQGWETDDFLSRPVAKHLKGHTYQLIHYWPEYCSTTMNEYIRRHPQHLVLADMYMPHPGAVLSDMRPIYEQYGLPSCEDSWLSQYARLLPKHFQEVQDVVVPSSYVKDTMQRFFPAKRYHVVPYGISVSPHYQKKAIVHEVRRFVYVGRISVEKGADFLLQFFSRHPQYELHLYGEILELQKFIFEPYKRSGNIHFHGTVSKQTLQKEIPSYDVGIHLSRFDAYSLAVGEIIGCGLPVIVSNKTGIKDDVCAHHLGVVVDFGETELESAISEIQNHYVDYVGNVDQYITSAPVSYGQHILNLYKTLLSRHDNTNSI